MKLKYQKKRFNQKFINRKFSTNPKAVNRDFKGNNITTEKLPAKENRDILERNLAEKNNF